MAQKIRFKLRRESLDSIRTSLSLIGQDSWYLFIGRPYPWSNENSPDSVNGSYAQETAAWRDMIGLARIDASNACLVARRINWTYGVAYEAYDHRIDYSSLVPHNYYVIVDDSRVYKCIFAPYQTTSTAPPIGTSTSIEETIDGYKWKYLYTIDSTLIPFLDSNYIPVRTLDLNSSPISYNDPRSLQLGVQLAAIPGGIEQINIDTGNSTSQFQYVNTVPLGDTNLIGDYVPSGSTVVKLGGPTGLSSTTNYYNGNIFNIVSGTQGEGQYRTIIAYDGITKQLTLDSPLTVELNTSSRYTILPSVNIAGDGFGAAARINLDVQQRATSITILSPGSGYNYVTAVPNVNDSEVLSSTPLVPIVSPSYGHGGDPESELYATNLVIKLKLDSKFTELPSDCSFRQYGLVKNPVLQTQDENNGVIAGDQIEKMDLITVKTVANPYAQLTYTVTFSTPYVLGNNFPVGSTVYQYDPSEAVISTGTVVDWSPSSAGTSGSVLTISVFTGNPIVTTDSTYKVGLVSYTNLYSVSSVLATSPDDVPQFSPNDYVEGDLIRGTSTSNTGELFRWLVNNDDRSTGRMIVSNPPSNWAVEKIVGDYKLEFGASNRLSIKFNAHAINNSTNDETNYFHIGDIITQVQSNIVSAQGVVAEWIPAPVGKTGSILKLDSLSGDPFICNFPLKNNGDSLAIFTPRVGDLIKSINPSEIVKYVTEPAKPTVTLTLSTNYVSGRDFNPGDTVYQGPSSSPVFGSPQSSRNDTAIGKVVNWYPSAVGSPGSKLLILPLSGRDFAVDGTQVIGLAGNPPTFTYVVSAVQNNRSLALSMETVYTAGKDFSFGDYVHQGPSAGTRYADGYVLDWRPSQVGSKYSVLVLTGIVGAGGHVFVTDNTGVIWKDSDSTTAYQVNGLILPDLEGLGKALSVDDFNGTTIRIKLGNALNTPLPVGSLICQVPIDPNTSTINRTEGYAGFIGATGSSTVSTAIVTNWEPAATGHSGSYVTLTNIIGARISDEGDYGLVPFGTTDDSYSNIPTIVPKNVTLTGYVGKQIISGTFDQYSFISNSDNTVYEIVDKISYRPVKQGEVVYKRRRLLKLVVSDVYTNYDFVPGTSIYQGIKSGAHIVPEINSGYRPYIPTHNVTGIVDIWNPIPGSAGSVVYVTDITEETTPFTVNSNFLVGPTWNALPNGEQYPPTETTLYRLDISSNYSSGNDFVVGSGISQSGATISMIVVGWKPSPVGTPGSRLYVTNVSGGPPIAASFDGGSLPFTYVVGSVNTVDNTPYFYQVSSVEEFDLNTPDETKRVAEITDIQTVFVDSVAADQSSATLLDIIKGRYNPKVSYRTTTDITIESPTALDSGVLVAMVSAKIIGKSSGFYGVCVNTPHLISSAGGVYTYLVKLVAVVNPGNGATGFDTNREPLSYIPISAGVVWTDSPIDLNSVVIAQSNSEIAHGSGSMVYIENIAPVTRKTSITSGTPVQSETIRIAIGL